MLCLRGLVLIGLEEGDVSSTTFCHMSCHAGLIRLLLNSNKLNVGLLQRLIQRNLSPAAVHEDNGSGLWQKLLVDLLE